MSVDVYFSDHVFQNSGNLPWVIAFFCYICVLKHIEKKVRLSSALDCSLPRSFGSLDPRSGIQDLHRSAKKCTVNFMGQLDWAKECPDTLLSSPLLHETIVGWDLHLNQWDG